MTCACVCVEKSPPPQDMKRSRPSPSSSSLQRLLLPPPPPCPPGYVCHLMPNQWADYWQRSPDGTALPHAHDGRPPRQGRASDVDVWSYCAVCGEWVKPGVPLNSVQALGREALRACTRTDRLCYACVRRCGACRDVITSLQHQRANGLCKGCVAPPRPSRSAR